MDFGDLFKRGWQITWNNKFLYVLAFLAALGGSGSSGGGGGSSRVNNIPTGNSGSEEFGAFEDLLNEFGFDFGSFESALPTIIGTAAAIICALLIVRIVLWLIRMVSEAGMIKSVAEINGGGSSNFKKAFTDGRAFLSPIFVCNLLLLIIPIAFVLALLGLGALLFFGGLGNFDDFSPLIFIPIICLGCLLVPYGFIVGLIYPIAQRGIVFKGMDAWASIKYGWQFLKKHAADILILGFLFTIVGFIVNIVALVASIPLLIGAGLPVFFAFMEGDTPGAGAIGLLVAGLIAMIVVAAAVSSIFIAFRSATFTLAYLELDGTTAAAPEEKGPDDLPVSPLTS